MKNKILNRTLLVTTILCILPFIYGSFFYSQLPESVVTHFSFNDQADGYSSKAMAVYGIPSILLVTNIIVSITLDSDPRRKKAQKLTTLVKFIIPLVGNFCSLLILSYALGKYFSIGRITMSLISVIMLIMGNYLPKCKQNYTIGFRLPWTLNSEENWNHTHRLAGWVWTIGSLVMLFCCIFLGKAYVTVSVIGIPLMTLIPILYSYRFF
ncbi:MAG: SdpI family protein, partial [Sphaerochaetaceae bacterium]